MSVQVKICGITNTRDAFRAVGYGADALGFVFHPDSPRAVNPAVARSIIVGLPPFVTTVGLFVNHSIDEVRQIRETAGFDLAQLHGDESPEMVSALGGWVIKAIRVQGLESLTGLAAYRPRAFLLDAYSETAYGGTGQRFDWNLAKLVEDVPIILAGGLNPANVADAVHRVNPYGVDVSSGVEQAPGRKDPAKLKAFIDNAKAVGTSPPPVVR